MKNNRRTFTLGEGKSIPLKDLAPLLTLLP